jgi:tRNA 2-selenouridine synthase
MFGCGQNINASMLSNEMSIISVDQVWSTPYPVVDVRAPIEFQKGHIPNAINIPLLDDKQRHQVGLRYRTHGREAAITLGLELVGPQMAGLAQRGMEISQGQPVVVYCQRGGKRSQSVSWLWSQLGISVLRLDGGYKAFRQSVGTELESPRRLLLLAGGTGVGKTECLQELEFHAESVLDLEGLANHKGSAFGGIGVDPQPAQAHFENRLAVALRRLPTTQSIWVEAESRRIGTVFLPESLWNQMQRAPRIYLERQIQDRIDRLCTDYQHATTADIEEALYNIRKRLGPQHYQRALTALGDNDRRSIVEIVLEYYDRTYDFHRQASIDRIVSSISVVDHHPISELMALRSAQDEKYSEIE